MGEKNKVSVRNSRKSVVNENGGSTGKGTLCGNRVDKEGLLDEKRYQSYRFVEVKHKVLERLLGVWENLPTK